MEVGKLNLHGDDRRNLAALLKAGVPSTKIIEDIQNKCLPTERLGLLTKKDLHNHAILVYKPVGSALTNNPLIKKQDFILCIMMEAQLELLEKYGKNIIMMDSTHGSNQYSYLLTTVMVCDDNHEGLPVAICYSNIVCSIILEPFFEKIRNRLTHLQPKVFMSDDDPAFWNAWQRVFGDVKYNLLCSWYVSRSWNRNLSSKKFPYTVENVSNETILTIDEDSNHLRREKEREANLREKEKSVVCEERAELVYERIRRRTQFRNTAASVASTEEMKHLDQCLEDLMKHMGYSEFGSSLQSIENFPANRYIIKQRQRKIPDL
ncbi:uncharacterized protein TNCV_1978941 [Trichonephila clavipes]|nr:uncharacterized protein TNCV_1978941 [Trichonephila clavipes]